jgi:hypothetical protein
MKSGLRILRSPDFIEFFGNRRFPDNVPLSPHPQVRCVTPDTARIELRTSGWRCYFSKASENNPMSPCAVLRVVRGVLLPMTAQAHTLRSRLIVGIGQSRAKAEPLLVKENAPRTDGLVSSVELHVT